MIALVSGTTGTGFALSADARAMALELWRAAVPPECLALCCWSAQEVALAFDAGVLPVVPPFGLRHVDEYAGMLAPLGSKALLFYSHPDLGLTLSPEVLTDLRNAGVDLLGAKVSKASSDEVAALRRAAGEDFLLWHGTGRSIGQSLAAGADAVVPGALAHLPRHLSGVDPSGLQGTVDEVNGILDSLHSEDERRSWLQSQVHTLLAD